MSEFIYVAEAATTGKAGAAAQLGPKTLLYGAPGSGKDTLIAALTTAGAQFVEVGGRGSYR